MDKLREAYSRLLLRFGINEFRVTEASRELNMEKPYLLMHRLCRAGYLVRVSKGVFRAVHPVVLALEWAGCRWRDKIAQKEYLPFLDLLVAKLVEGFWGRLVSLIIFGSLAAGRAKAESDIDLLIVAEGLPERYSDRLRLWRRVVSGLEVERLRLWRERGIYPLIDPILLTPEEAGRVQPFYLDLLNASIIVYDRGGFMRGVLERLRAKLRELGSIKVELPNGAWYWVVKPDAGVGEVIEV